MTEEDSITEKDKIRKMIEDDINSGLIDEIEKELEEMEDDDLWVIKEIELIRALHFFY